MVVRHLNWGPQMKKMSEFNLISRLANAIFSNPHYAMKLISATLSDIAYVGGGCERSLADLFRDDEHGAFR